MEKLSTKEHRRFLRNKRDYHLGRIRAINTLLYSHNKDQTADLLIIERIIDVVCEVYMVTIEELKGRAQFPAGLMMARQMSMYLISDRCESFSTVTIGLEFNRVHATAIYAIRKIKGLIKVDKGFRVELEIVERILDSKDPGSIN